MAPHSTTCIAQDTDGAHRWGWKSSPAPSPRVALEFRGWIDGTRPGSSATGAKEDVGKSCKQFIVCSGIRYERSPLYL